jgi:flagellar M-ring protein FliF
MSAIELQQKAVSAWQGISLIQKSLLIAFGLTFVIGGGLMFNWASQPDMKLMYSDLSPGQAGKITEILEEKNIPYEVSNGGTSIYAPSGKVDELRLTMAKEGLPESDQKGYSIFDNDKIGVSPFVQDVNFRRAIEDELAKSVQMLDGVTHARIHIVNSEKKVFGSKNKDGTASVALKLKPGYNLSSSTIAAITHLVAGGVEGLESKNVNVMDSEGRMLSQNTGDELNSSANTAADYRERIENNYSRKVEEMLTRVLGSQRASVKVSADIDMNSVSIVTEDYEPKGVPTKEEIQTENETGAPTYAEDGEQLPGMSKTSETITNEMKVGKTVREIVTAPGRVKSLKVAAFVDLSIKDANGQPTGEKIMEVTAVEQVIQNALGLEDSEDIEVVDVKFNQDEVFEEEQEGLKLDYVAIAGQASMGIMAICALLVLKMFGGGKNKAIQSVGRQLQSGEQLNEIESGAGNSGYLPEGQQQQPQQTSQQNQQQNTAGMLRDEIANAMKENPEQAKKLFANWAEDKD